MLKSFKTEIDPTEEQKIKIHKTIGTCRYIYNFYLFHNKERYDAGERFMSGKSFSVWLNNEYLPGHPEYFWIREVSSKSVNFVKNNPKDCLCERHRIKIPTLGWVRLKEKGYIPTSKDGYVIRSGAVSMKAGRYYVSALVDIPAPEADGNLTDGIGIDLGLKDFAVVSNGTVYRNINKTARIRKLEKQLRRAQRKLSRKYENLKKGKSTQRANICKQKLKVQKLHHRIENIRTDHINKVISEIVKTKPSHITIEDLNISGMMKDRHLSKAVASQKFYEFRPKLN